MKLLHRLPAWLKNKYFISFTAFTIILLFLDKNDVLTQYGRYNELQELRQSRAYYNDQINAERTELEQLKRDAGTLEKYARENYLMKKDGEDLFLITENHENTKN